MPGSHGRKRLRDTSQRQANSANPQHSSQLPPFSGTNVPSIVDEANYQQPSVGGMPGLGRRVQDMALGPVGDQTSHQPWPPSDTGLPNGQPLDAVQYQPGNFAGVLSQLAIDGTAGTAGAYDSVGHGRSMSTTAFNGSQENSPHSSFTLAESDPQDEAPVRLQQVEKKGKRRGSQSVRDNAPAMKRSHTKVDTKKFVQDQQQEHFTSRAEKNKKQAEFLTTFETSFEDGQPTTMTSHGTASTQCPLPWSHYNQADGDTCMSSNDVDTPDAAEGDLPLSAPPGHEGQNQFWGSSLGYQSKF